MKHERMTGEEMLAEALIEMLEDDGVVVTPKRLTEADIPWTTEEIKHVVSNAWQIIRRLPNLDMKLLQNMTSQTDVVRTDPGDHSGNDEQDRYLNLRNRIRITAPRHHVDQLDDVLHWMFWLKPKHRRVVWAVARFSDYDYARLPWAKIARYADVPCPSTGNRRSDTQNMRREAKRRYGAALRGLCRKLNDENYPRRLSRTA